MPSRELVFPDALAREHAQKVEAVVRAHLEAHPLQEWAREVTRLRGLVPAERPDLTAVPWRQGRSHPANVWAATGPDWQDHQPAGRMDSAELAAEAVRAHNALSDLLWLLGAGHNVQLGAHDDSGGPAFYVRLLGDGGGSLESFSGRRSLGQALADARGWSERQGLTP